MSRRWENDATVGTEGLPLFRPAPPDPIALERGALAAEHVARGGRPVRLDRPSMPIDTSEDAAEAIKPDAAAIRERVFDYVRATGVFGAIEQEIEGGLGLPGNTVRPRLWELENDGRIVKSTRTRQTRAGRKARVYVAL